MIVTSKIPSAISDLCLPATLEEKPTFSQSEHKMFPLAAAAFFSFLFFPRKIYVNDPLTAEIADLLQLKTSQHRTFWKEIEFGSSAATRLSGMSPGCTEGTNPHFIIRNKYCVWVGDVFCRFWDAVESNNFISHGESSSYPHL